MKITLFISSLSGGGAERVVVNLANYLAAKGHDTEILSLSDKTTYIPESGVKVVYLYKETGSKIPHLLINVLRLLNFKKYLLRRKPDVYLTFLPRLSTLLIKNRKQAKAPIIVAERCSPESRPENIRKPLLEIYRYADGYQFQTEDAKAYYAQNGYDLTNSIVLPNAINPAFIRKPIDRARRKSVIGVGRLDQQKNFALLIRAFAAISDQHPDYVLEIYGDGSEKTALSDLAASLGIENRVSLMGFVDNIPEAIEDASLFVLSSDFEGMPNALAEAMALGLPCISTDCPAGGSRFLIDDGVNGRLVPVGDVDAMAKAIDEILSDPAKAKEMGDKARNVARDLAPEKIYSQWERFITDIVNLHKNKDSKK